MLYGTIVEYFPDKSFGFIRPDSGKDIFFHISTVEAGETPPKIKLGQPVKYELTPREEASSQARAAGGKEGVAKRRWPAQTRAKLVVLIDKLPGSTLAESDESNKALHHQRARQKKPTWRR